MLEIMKFLYDKPVAYFGLLFFILIVIWGIKEIVNAFHNPYKVSYMENVIIEKDLTKESDENVSK